MSVLIFTRRSRRPRVSLEVSYWRDAAKRGGKEAKAGVSGTHEERREEKRRDDDDDDDDETRGER